MTDQTKWMVLLPPLTATGAAEHLGTFDTEQEAWDWVAKQPTETAIRMRVLRDRVKDT